MSECVLCDIVAGSEAAARIRDDGTTLAFIALPPATEGHVLLVPKRHTRNLFDISRGDLAAVAAAAKQLALRQRERLGCIGVSMSSANEADGFQSMFHYYVHVVPRYPGDGLVPSWRSPMLPLAEREAMARRLRADRAISTAYGDVLALLRAAFERGVDACRDLRGQPTEREADSG